MYTTLINDEINPLVWNSIFLKSTKASWFQSHSCYEFYKTLDFVEAFAIAISLDNEIQALVCGYFISDGNILKKYMSRRAIIPGGIMLSDKCNDDALALLLNNLTKHTSKKAIYTEMRNYFDYSSYREVFEKVGYKYNDHLNFHVQTQSVEGCLKQLSSTKRRDIKQSLKQGAKIVNTKNSDDIKEYFRLLNDLYKTKIKTPLFPFSFFENILKKDDCHLFAIKFENRIIGGSLCVGTPETVLYEWFVCGLDGHFKNIYPSTLATWAAIEYAATNNYQYFDMMGAGKPNEGYGVRDFKAKFGGSLVEHGRFLKINDILKYMIGSSFVKYLKKR